MKKKSITSVVLILFALQLTICGSSSDFTSPYEVNWAVGNPFQYFSKSLVLTCGRNFSYKIIETTS